MASSNGKNVVHLTLDVTTDKIIWQVLMGRELFTPYL